jgi:hypothetical protein
MSLAPDRPLQILLSLCLILSLFSCKPDPGERIVDDAIEAHGGAAYGSFTLAFDFRNRHYTATRDGGIFTYTREFRDSTGNITDLLNNEGFTRYLNNSVVDLPEKRKKAFTSSVNSVIYFALLPFGLNDRAVNKEWLRETEIDSKRYDVVRVTFDPTGGGSDHQDVFLYWFDQQTHTMDYLAYTYETEGGGLRFRKAVNPRVINGIRLQDYINYKPKDETVPVDSLESMFVEGKLEILSEIKLENAVVTDIDDKQASDASK